MSVEIFTTRPYSDNPYLVFPNGHPYHMRIGSTRQTLRAFVYQRSCLFGDPLPLELAGLTISVKIYNNQNQLVSIGQAIISNQDTSEIEYTWNQLDIRTPGIYYSEFVFKDIDDSTFVLPEKGSRLEIIAS